MELSILSGIYTGKTPAYRTAYPLNMMPCAYRSGVSSTNTYLKPAEGVVLDGVGTGLDRGGINWRDQCYRVMGTTLLRINANKTTTVIGEVGGTGQVSFTYGFDRLAIASGGNLYYYNGTTLVQVTDPDLGTVLDVLWVDGYFVTTDGAAIVVTDLNDPMQVNPLKYGSSEASPDPIVALKKLRNEIAAINRYTIEIFDNVGGNLFPFARVEAAQIQRGALSATCATVINGVLAFLGGGVNERPSIWLSEGAASKRLATQEVDAILANYTEAQLAGVIMEQRVTNGQTLLYVHLPDKTLVYDADATAQLEQPVWFVLSTSLDGEGVYRARGFVWCYDQWLCGDPVSAQYGHLSDSTMSHYNNRIGWEFSTFMMFNEGRDAVVHSLELVGITGRMAMGTNTTVSTSYSSDGLKWSMPRSISMGKTGETQKRLQWRNQGMMRQTRVQRFQGTSDAYAAFTSLVVEAEPFSV